MHLPLLVDDGEGLLLLLLLLAPTTTVLLLLPLLLLLLHSCCGYYCYYSYESYSSSNSGSSRSTRRRRNSSSRDSSSVVAAVAVAAAAAAAAAGIRSRVRMYTHGSASACNDLFTQPAGISHSATLRHLLNRSHKTTKDPRPRTGAPMPALQSMLSSAQRLHLGNGSPCSLSQLLFGAFKGLCAAPKKHANWQTCRMQDSAAVMVTAVA